MRRAHVLEKLRDDSNPAEVNKSDELTNSAVVNKSDEPTEKCTFAKNVTNMASSRKRHLEALHREVERQSKARTARKSLEPPSNSAGNTKLPLRQVLERFKSTKLPFERNLG